MFFKAIARTHRNFTNLCYSLTTNHQLLQSILLAGNLLKPCIVLNDSIPFSPELYNTGVTNSVQGVELNSSNSVVCQKLTLRGTEYRKGQHIAIAKVEDGLTVGEIMLIVVRNDIDVYFVVRAIRCEHVSHFHVYRQLSHLNDETVCISANEMLDYHPLCGYLDSHHLLCFALKHFL